MIGKALLTPLASSLDRLVGRRLVGLKNGGVFTLLARWIFSLVVYTLHTVDRWPSDFVYLILFLNQCLFYIIRTIKNI